MKFIGAHRESWGVEPICKTLQVAPSTYYAAVSRHAQLARRRSVCVYAEHVGNTQPVRQTIGW